MASPRRSTFAEGADTPSLMPEPFSIPTITTPSLLFARKPTYAELGYVSVGSEEESLDESSLFQAASPDFSFGALSSELTLVVFVLKPKLSRLTWTRTLRWTLLPGLALLAVAVANRGQASLIRSHVSRISQKAYAQATGTSSHLLPTGRPSSAVVALPPQTPYFCPSPTLARPSLPFQPSDLSPWHELESSSLDFSISLAYALHACNQFRIKITRSDVGVCRRAKKQNVSEDEETRKHIMEELGPDTFQLRVDGAERYVVDRPARFDVEGCEYEFDFRLSTPGVVWFSGMLVFEHNIGYDEIHTSSPDGRLNITAAALLSRPLELNICEASCMPYTSSILSTKPYTFSPLAPSPPAPATLPACTSSDPIPGAYVSTSLPSLLYPPVPLPFTSGALTAGLYDFVPHECSYQHDGLRFRNHSSCLKERRGVFFTGDSHTRSMYDVLLHRFQGNDSILQLSEKMPEKAAQLDNLHLEFLWDPLLENTLDCDFVRDYNAIVISTGAHQAFRLCDSTPATAYLAHLSTIFSTWPALAAKCLPPDAPSPIFIYMNSPSYWYPTNLHRYDCRTSPRLGYWNDRAGKLARENGWRLIDAFALSKPFAVDTRLLDGTHYMKTDAIDPVADELIEKLEICGTTVGSEKYRVW